MKLYHDLYCKNDSLHGGTRVTIVNQYEETIFLGTFDELGEDYWGSEDPIKVMVAQWVAWHATVSEYHIVSVSTTVPDGVCAVPLTDGVYISELYVKMHDEP